MPTPPPGPPPAPDTRRPVPAFVAAGAPMVGRKCVCGNWWCGKDVDGGAGFRLTAPKKKKDKDGVVTIDSSAGEAWLRAVGDVTQSQVAVDLAIKRLRENKEVRLHKSHWWPMDLLPGGPDGDGNATRTRISPQFRASPRFRPMHAIDQNLHAPPGVRARSRVRSRARPS